MHDPPNSRADQLPAIRSARVDSEHVCQSGVAGRGVDIGQTEPLLEIPYACNVGIGRAVDRYRRVTDIGGLIVSAYDARCRSRDWACGDGGAHSWTAAARRRAHHRCAFQHQPLSRVPGGRA